MAGKTGVSNNVNHDHITASLFALLKTRHQPRCMPRSHTEAIVFASIKTILHFHTAGEEN
jgi:hypothetical protein